MKISPRLIPFLLIAVIHLIALLLNETKLALYTKPLLMPSLLLYFLLSSKPSPLRFWICLALVMSFLGDTFLMFAQYKTKYFLFGLASFLMAHIAYIVINYQTTKSESIMARYHWHDLLFITYGVAIFYLLSSSLGGMYYPTMVYTAVICLMAISARQRKGLCDELSFRFVFIGACLFVVSDSILAYNKFVATIPYERLAVMSTYLTAQWLIIEGYLEYLNKPDSK